MLGAQSPLAVRPKVCTTLTRNLTTRARHRVPDLECGTCTHAHCVLVRNMQVVYDWLKALKAVNPLYRDIVIDESEPTIRALNQVKDECAHARTHARTAATHKHSNTYSQARARNRLRPPSLIPRESLTVSTSATLKSEQQSGPTTLLVCAPLKHHVSCAADDYVLTLARTVTHLCSRAYERARAHTCMRTLAA